MSELCGVPRDCRLLRLNCVNILPLNLPFDDRSRGSMGAAVDKSPTCACVDFNCFASLLFSASRNAILSVRMHTLPFYHTFPLPRSHKASTLHACSCLPLVHVDDICGRKYDVHELAVGQATGTVVGAGTICRVYMTASESST